MPQFDYGIIDPSTKSGSQLASDLNNHRSSLHSFHLGASEPPYKVAGMVWVDNSANPIWYMKLYDGSAWIPIISINTLSDSASAYINGILAALGTAAERNIGTGSNNVPLNSMLGALAYASVIGTANIANAAITSPLIAGLAVGTTQLANGGVTSQKIATGAVTLDKLASLTPNQALVTDSSGAVALVSRLNKSGMSIYSDVGTHTFVVPEGITTVSAWVIGAGGGGSGSWKSSVNGMVMGTAGGASSFGSYLTATGGSNSSLSGYGVKSSVVFGVEYTGTAGDNIASGSGGTALMWGAPLYQPAPAASAYTSAPGIWPGGGGGSVVGAGSPMHSGGAGGTAYGVMSVVAGQEISITVGAGGTPGLGARGNGGLGANGMVMVEWW